MIIQNREQVAERPVEMPGAVGCTVRWLVGKAENAPNFAMRQFAVQPGGHTPRHFHDYEHEVFVLEGNGTVLAGDVERPLAEGDVVFVSPGEVHQFRNTGSEVLKFLCLVPNSSYDLPISQAPECGDY